MRKVVARITLTLLVIVVFWIAVMFALSQTPLFSSAQSSAPLGDGTEPTMFICGNSLMEDMLDYIVKLALLSFSIAVPMALITTFVILPFGIKQVRRVALRPVVDQSFDLEDVDTQFD